MLGPALLLKIAVVSELLAGDVFVLAGSEEADPDFSPYYSSTTQMARDKGADVIKYEVRTEDGYHLGMHRLIGGRGPPVLLVHGLLASSDQWFITTPSYAMVLADAGYDVWMGNFRGNLYSHRHDYLSPEDDLEFWNFTLHEMAYYDVPAMIDKVLQTTGHQQLFYSGYSIGGTLFLMMASTRPEYADKVKGAFLLAPLLVRPSSLANLPTFLRMTFEFMFAFVKLLQDNHVGEFYPRQMEVLKVLEKACHPSSQTFHLCVRILEVPFGLYPSEYDVTRLQYLLKSFGTGISTKAVEHMMQIYQIGQIRQFSYGESENQVVYGSKEPPGYDLSKVTTPVAFYYDKNDQLIDYKAVQLVVEVLPCVLCDCMTDNKGFSHFGYIISSHTDIYIFQKVLQSMSMLTSKTAKTRVCT